MIFKVLKNENLELHYTLFTQYNINTDLKSAAFYTFIVNMRKLNSRVCDNISLRFITVLFFLSSVKEKIAMYTHKYGMILMAAKYREFLVGKWSYYVMEKNLYQFVYKMWWQLYKTM